MTQNFSLLNKYIIVKLKVIIMKRLFKMKLSSFEDDKIEKSKLYFLRGGDGPDGGQGGGDPPPSLP